ncbi:MAG: glycoside hydrolase family 3 C-terminal domain-containing protein, partial [Bacteroidales bacterium]|nr:glycoside hydrolase family 3 C-terminal domain-containing protein [Bacteroidales bacterium]
MKTLMQILIVILTILFGLTFKTSTAQDYLTNAGKEKSDFKWPDGKKMGLSLTFDDARLSQVDKGIPLLDKYGVKATFYVSPVNMTGRLDGWKKALSSGHDIGNHSLLHPCTINYGWPQEAALENYNLNRMSLELDSASSIIENTLGIKPSSFAYPCGQSFVGKGLYTKSYIPLVASKFETGRLWLSEGPNDPTNCDMSQLTGMELDGKSFDQIKKLIESARNQGGWLVLAGHEMNDSGNQTSLLSTIEALCEYASDPANGIWIDNVHNIASYINKERGVTISSELPLYLNPLFSIDQRVEDLLSRMTLEEKLGQLNSPCPGLMEKELPSQINACLKFAEGKYVPNIGPAGGIWAPTGLYREGPRPQAEFLNQLQKIAVEKTRLKIPLLFFEEGTHGLLTPGATVFPEGLAIGSTWDMDLVQQIYSVAAKEGRSRGVHFLGTLVIEPNRDPRLGRNEEGYSEDPYLCSQIAEAIVAGMQGEDISADDKAISLLCHFPGQSQPVSGMERGAMEITERTLREVFLPPWVAGIKKAGALAVMATYPAIDGLPVHASEKILTKILREELDFNGLVILEGEGIKILVYEQIVSTMKESGELCLKAGVDVSIWHEDGYMNAMRENVNEGKVSIETIDRSVRRILRIKYLLGLFENPYVDVERAVRENNTKENRELALRTAREGIVLLKNEKNLLPLKKNIKSIAVIGPNAVAGKAQLGDYIADTILQEIVSVLDGVKSKVSPQTKVNYVRGCEIIGDKLNEISNAVNIAKKSDLAIVVLGETSERPAATNGEGFDVASLDLTGLQEELLKAVYATGTPTILVLINGRPLSIRWAAENIPAIVEAWNCGEQGGYAVADVLFGDYNPGGRLPITFPRHSGQLPMYYNYMPSKEYWKQTGWGRAYADMPASPLWEFGFGLSYTTFEYSNLQITPKEIGPAGEVYVSVDVKNSGKLEGTEVVQLYI